MCYKFVYYECFMKIINIYNVNKEYFLLDYYKVLIVNKFLLLIMKYFEKKFIFDYDEVDNYKKLLLDVIIIILNFML